MKKLLIVLTFISGLLFSQQVMLSVSGQTIDEVNGGSLDIYMVNTDPVYGFQINIDDSGLLGDISGIQYGVASGGTAQDATFMVSTNASGLILGFSVTGSSIPAGEGILTTINWNGDTFPSVSGIITLSVTAISGIDGAALTYGIDTPFFIGAVDDCAGVPGGNAFIDDCGICSGGTTGLTPNADMDCTGLCFGDAQLFTYCFDEDDDGMGTPGTETNYCDALVDPGWIADCTDSVPDCFSNETDCAGICDGTAVYDCAEVCGGSAFQDMCGACDDTPDNDCEQDCLGIWGGTAIVDDCEMCVEPENFNQDMDCASICFGQSLEDCAGICDGSNYEDECGICNDNPNDDESDMDCAAICFGNALEDICGVCDDNPSNDGACVGCTDPNADNYEPDNTIEDGSCTYPTTGNVVINELQIWPLNPSFGEEFSEFIELLNISQFTLDLAGWTIASNSGSMAIQESYLLEPSSFIVLAISSNENLNLGIPVDYAWGFGSGLQLSNASDNIQIHDNAGSLIDEVQYDTGTWSINPGQSIELTHPLMNNNSLYNWVPGTIVYDSAGNLGTPGEYNTSLIQIPEIVLSQPEADFGVLWFGDSDSMEITITSTGGSDLTVLGFQFEDQSPMIGYDFPSIPFTLAIDETETFTVYFTPTELNMVYLDTLTILSNAPSNEQLTFPINGMGSLPEIQILNPTVTADSIYVNDSQIIVAELQNIGYYELELYDALMQNENSDFSVITPLPYVIVGQSTGLIEILFSPSTMGPIADTLYLSTTDPGQPQAQYGLMGYGLMANIQVYQTQLNFPTIHSDETMSAGITVANTGNGLLEISASTNSGNFVPESSNYAVYPDSTVWVQVNFTPTYVGGYSAQLYLNTNDPYQQMVTIALTASAISPTIVFVPLDAATVQGAIDMAEDGDTVLVAPGTYYESLNTLGKNITLLSESGAENTIIDAGAGVFGTGADGELVVNAGETYYTDDVRSAIIGDNPPGQNTIQVEDVSGFQVGDEVLIITMGHNEENEALNLTGQYETRHIAGINGQVLSLDNQLTHDFSVVYSDTFQGVFNTSNNSFHQGSWETNKTIGYEIVFYDKVKITKLKVFQNHENWSLWDRSGNLLYQQEFSPLDESEWREYDPESELIIEPGEYIITAYGTGYDTYSRYNWGNGGYYQSFRHGVVEFTRQISGNSFPSGDNGYFGSCGFMVDFEYELIDPILKHQIIKIHNYSNIENNGEMTAHNWDGKTGGIVFFRTVIQIINNGIISTNGKGYRGGDGQEHNQYYSNGWRGEGIFGLSEGPTNNGQYGSEEEIRNQRLGAGGGAGSNGGGGGAGYGSIGENGWNNGGYHGNVVGSPELIKLRFGSAGGSGGFNHAAYGDYRRKGGNGGGILAVFAKNLITNNSFEANGMAGQDYYNGDYPGGGGGAGGSVWLIAINLLNTGNVSANGGICGSSYYGGDGGYGRIRLDFNEGQQGYTYPDIGYTELLSEPNTTSLRIVSMATVNGFTFSGYNTVTIDSSDVNMSNCKILMSGLQPDPIEAQRTETLNGVLLEITGGNPVFDNIQFTNQLFDWSGIEGLGTYIHMEPDSVTFNNCTFSNLETEVSGSAASRQGNVIYQEQGKSVFNDCQFTENLLSGTTVTQQTLEGGVMYINDGEVLFTGSTFTGNRITSYSSVIPKGGVIYGNNSQISLQGCVLDSNMVSGNGKGVLVFSEGDQSSLTLINVNTAENTGTELFHFTSGGTLTVTDSHLSENIGHGIFSQSGLLTADVINSEINNNTGYGLWANGSKTVSSSSVSGNSLGGIKGAGSLTLNLSSVDNNIGTGISGTTGSFNSTGSSFTGNTLQAVNATATLNFNNVDVIGNGSGISGSGVINFVDVNINNNTGFGLNYTGNKTFETVSISNNSGYGISGGTGNLTFTNVDINNNSSYGLNANGNMIFNNVNINDNGAYGLTGNGVLNFTDVNILNNSVYGISGSGNKTLQTVNIKDNGGSGISGSGTLALSDVIIRDNSGFGATGFTGIVSASNSTISGNNGGLVGSGTVSMTLEICHVDSNLTSQNGGGIRLTGSLTLTDVTVNSNSGNNGGGVYLTGDLLSNNSSFDHNHSNTNGGGVYVDGTASFIESDIIENTAILDGSGIWSNGLLSLENSSVIDNTANSEGGGIYGTGTLNIGFSELNNNSASADGGGLWWGSGQVTVERSDILHNSSNRGGGVFILAENPIFQFDVISHNDATTIGGGMYLSKSSDASSTPIIFNSTVVYNTSAVLGSGLLCTNQTNPVVQNAIFWGNLAADGVQMHLQGSSEIFVTFSDVAGGQSGIVGFDDIIFQNNIDLFPDFVSVADEDYHLMITSPCIDTGNPNAPFDPDGTIPDMGAYYFAQDGIPNIETPLSLIDFGGVPILATGEQVITISNQGLSGLIVFGVVIDPPVFSTTDSSFVLAAGETFDVPVNFTPDGEGIFDGSITFMNNDPDEGQFTVNLHGAGDALAILDVLDVPNDEGGMVGVHWHRNVFDGIDGSDHILNYRVWREYMQGRTGSETEMDDDNLSPTIWTREVVTENGELRTEAWELMGTVPAQQFEEYAFTSPTLFDSTSAGIPWTTFLVSAHTADPLVFYEAIPDSGYSIDNLAPAAPDNLVGGMSGDSSVELTWSFNPPADFNYFSIYRDGLFISAMTDTSYMDTDLPQSSEVQYYVTATDYHENESDASAPLQVELLPLQIQQLTLNQLRWNNISFNLNLADNSIESIFSESDILVIHDDSGNYFVPSVNVHSLENIQIEKGYQVYTTGQADIFVSAPGYAIDPANYPIELLPLHMNNISFLPSEPMSVESAFDGLPILMVKNSNGNYYIPNFGVNTIDPAGGLLPGLGYEVFILGIESVLFTYDPLTTLARYMPSDISRQTYNMMASQHYDIESTGLSQPIVITNITGNVESGDEIAVFANGEIVGATRIVDSTSPVLITAWAGFHDFDIDLPGYESGDEIDIRLWKSSENRELKIIADLDSPYFGQSPLITGSLIVTSTDIVPQTFVLHPAYPNPFNPITTVSYDLPLDSHVTISVYDLAGHLITELIDESRSAGSYQITWNASNQSSGVYLVKMVAGDFQSVQKVMLVK